MEHGSRGMVMNQDDVRRQGQDDGVQYINEHAKKKLCVGLERGSVDATVVVKNCTGSTCDIEESSYQQKCAELEEQLAIMIGNYQTLMASRDTVTLENIVRPHLFMSFPKTKSFMYMPSALLSSHNAIIIT